MLRHRPAASAGGCTRQQLDKVVPKHISHRATVTGSFRQSDPQESRIICICKKKRFSLYFCPSAPQETNPSPPQPDEDAAEETGQEIVSPEAYIKHPLQNRLGAEV